MLSPTMDTVTEGRPVNIYTCLWCKMFGRISDHLKSHLGISTTSKNQNIPTGIICILHLTLRLDWIRGTDTRGKTEAIRTVYSYLTRRFFTRYFGNVGLSYSLTIRSTKTLTNVNTLSKSNAAHFKQSFFSFSLELAISTFLHLINLALLSLSLLLSRLSSYV